jgi:hypothetical protein
MTKEELLPAEEVRAEIPSIDSDGEASADEIIIKVKYFLASFTWLVAKCEALDDGDVLFYGFVINAATPDFSEWGNFTLSELMGVKLFGALGVERDLWFKECTFGEYMRGEVT